MDNRALLSMLQELRICTERNRNMLDDYRQFAKEAADSNDPKVATSAEMLLASHERLDAYNNTSISRSEGMARTVTMQPRKRRVVRRKKRDWWDKMTDWIC